MNWIVKLINRDIIVSFRIFIIFNLQLIPSFSQRLIINPNNSALIPNHTVFFATTITISLTTHLHTSIFTLIACSWVHHRTFWYSCLSRCSDNLKVSYLLFLSVSLVSHSIRAVFYFSELTKWFSSYNLNVQGCIF